MVLLGRNIIQNIELAVDNSTHSSLHTHSPDERMITAVLPKLNNNYNSVQLQFSTVIFIFINSDIHTFTFLTSLNNCNDMIKYSDKNSVFSMQ